MDNYSKLSERIKELDASGKLDKTKLKKEIEEIKALEKLKNKKASKNTNQQEKLNQNRSVNLENYNDVKFKYISESKSGKGVNSSFYFFLIWLVIAILMGYSRYKELNNTTKDTITLRRRGSKNIEIQNYNKFRLECNNGDADGCAKLGQMLGIEAFRKGRINEFDPMEQKALFIKACNMGSGLGCTEWGTMIEDEKEGLKYHKKGCDLGNGLGCQRVGHYYFSSDRGDSISKEAKVYYEKGCELKDWESCEMLLGAYKNEIDVARIERLRDESRDVYEKTGWLVRSR